MDRVILKKHRRSAVDRLFEKYPKGFTVRQMVDEYPRLYNKTKQGTDFLVFMRANEGNVRMVRDGMLCKYIQVCDTYKMLEKLWPMRA